MPASAGERRKRLAPGLCTLRLHRAEARGRRGAFPLPHPSSSIDGSGTQGAPLCPESCVPRPLCYLTSGPASAAPPRFARSRGGRDFSQLRVPRWPGPSLPIAVSVPSCVERLGAAAETRRSARLSSRAGNITLER